MQNATDLLSGYAAYHRDRRNIISHAVGVPLIVFALGVLLARPIFDVGDWHLTPAIIVSACATAWYLSRGDLMLGLAASAAIGLLTLAGHRVAHAGGVLPWLTWSVGTFVIGRAIQSAGHWYEGRRKPAFFEGLVDLLVAPMFVVAEAMFSAGWNPRLQAEIERRAGPTRLRDLARIAA